ncbi:hypothetical protein PENSPDRAFT_304396 [Peniophora sp. CONT]|nr:hypothetical protein PENSPDRAFT_304396 [Peniophora sp. CONT]
MRIFFGLRGGVRSLFGLGNNCVLLTAIAALQPVICRRIHVYLCERTQSRTPHAVDAQWKVYSLASIVLRLRVFRATLDPVREPMYTRLRLLNPDRLRTFVLITATRVHWPASSDSTISRPESFRVGVGRSWEDGGGGGMPRGPTESDACPRSPMGTFRH